MEISLSEFEETKQSLIDFALKEVKRYPAASMLWQAWIENYERFKSLSYENIKDKHEVYKRRNNH